MSIVSSKTIEEKVLALLLVSPTHLKAIELDTDLFAFNEHKTLLKIIKDYVKKYKSAPTIDSLLHFANTKINESSNVELLEALEILTNLPQVDQQEASYCFDKILDYKIGRDIYDFNNYLANEFVNADVDFKLLRKELIKKLLDMDVNEEHIQRGYVFSKENIIKNLSQYRERQSGNDPDWIGFGIPSLDDATGGMRKCFVTLAYSKSGGGKSIFAINVAYNAMMAGHSVVYFSIEMPHNLISTKFFSRRCLLDSKKIIRANLSDAEFDQYKQKLANHIKDSKNKDLYVVDVPAANMLRVRSELERYRNTYGIYPSLVILDYANILAPTDNSNDRSVQLDHLFKELHEFAKYYNCGILTMLQESRKSMLDSISNSKNKTTEVEGLHNIGASHFAATHCENVIHLKQTETEARLNKIIAVIDKSRYGGSTGKKLFLHCMFDLTYIGDGKIEY